LRLIAEPGAVERFLGFAPRERFLMPNTALDARHVIYPPLLIDGDRGFMLLEEIERGSVPAAALPPGVTPSYYAPYFRWDPAERSQIPHTVCDALRQVAGDVEVAVDAFASIFLVRAIRASVPAELAAPWRNRTWRRRRIRTHDVEARFRRTRSAATEAALLSLKGDRDERRLRNAVEGARSGGRFASLDALLGEVGLDVVVLSAPLNVQDVTGITVSDLLWPALALYERGADYVEMLEPCAGEAATISLAEVATRLRGRRFGIDEQYLTVGQALACGLAIDEGAAVSDAVRAWRERASAFDTPYFVLAAKVTTAAIAATLETLRGRLGAAGMSEVDVERVLGGEYRRALGRFDNAGSFRVRNAHMNVHAGSRTTRPSLPTDYRMGSAETSLKIDSGVFLMEPDGLVRAATDMGRTLVQGGAALEMYDVLRRAVADHAVPAARAGASGRDVFLAATGGLDAQREAIDRTGLGPRVGRFQEAYARYVGHTMDKQRHVSVHFTSTSTERLEVGMTGSIELPWAWDRYGLQYEDMFWAGEDAGLNLTRDIP
jgi:Xaa-Pro aminopeptidase